MKAMILAAGFGTRLGELTKHSPKCLIDINGKPIIRLVAENLKKAGVSSVIINLHYMPEAVQQYCSTGLTDLFESIVYSREPEILGTGGGLKAARNFLQAEDFFFLVNADIYSDFDLSKLEQRIEQHRNALGVLAVMEREDRTYLSFDSNAVFTGWLNAGENVREGQSVKAFCGMQLLSGRIFDYLKLNQDKAFSIIETYCAARDAGEILLAEDIGNQSDWFDMGTVQQLHALRNHLKK